LIERLRARLKGRAAGSAAGDGASLCARAARGAPISIDVTNKVARGRMAVSAGT